MAPSFINVTIKDVALDANVSTATVSHVINKTRYVSPETTKRVNDAIKRLNYYPNRLVGSLRNKGTYTVGLVVPSIINETFSVFVETVQRILFDFGYNLIVSTTSYNQETEKKALESFLMKKVDAIIAIPSHRNSQTLRKLIASESVPVVLVDRLLEGVSVDSVVVDNFAGQYEATSYLIKLGHRKIGYIDRMSPQSHSIAQRNGFIAALTDAGIPVCDNCIVNVHSHYYEGGIQAAKQLIQNAPDITAIAAYYDITAVGAMRGLMELGYSLPKDISIIGFDNMRLTAATWPLLSSVAVPMRRVAKETCKIIKQRLDAKYKHPDEPLEAVKSIVVPPKLIIRDSVAPPRDR